MNFVLCYLDYFVCRSVVNLTTELLFPLQLWKILRYIFDSHLSLSLSEPIRIAMFWWLACLNSFESERAVRCSC